MASFGEILHLLLLFAGISMIFGQMYHSSYGQEECKDRSRLCASYKKEKCMDKKSSHYSFMKKYCRKFCGYCDCKNWVHGCCKDRKTPAEGPNEQGCARILCYDVKPDSCIEYKREGKCDEDENYATTTCPWACNKCYKKSPAPIKSCHNIGFGCCWDGTTALGPNGRGCRPCVDFYRHACKQFRIRPSCYNTGAFFKRKFLLEYCPNTCGFCPEHECSDKDNRCRRWLYLGYCDNNPVWGPYVRENCRKTCGFCKGPGQGNLLP